MHVSIGRCNRGGIQTELHLVEGDDARVLAEGRSDVASNPLLTVGDGARVVRLECGCREGCRPGVGPAPARENAEKENGE
mgnify:CR=1 FL=1